MTSLNVLRRPPQRCETVDARVLMRTFPFSISDTGACTDLVSGYVSRGTPRTFRLSVILGKVYARRGLTKKSGFWAYTPIMVQLPEYMGLPFEALCREWVRLASAQGALPEPVSAVGTWWNADHEIDVVGLDAQRQVVVTGECKWRTQGFTWSDLQTYLGHVRALAEVAPLRPDALHLLFSKNGFDPRVEAWAAGTHARLIGPTDLVASL